MHKRLLLFALLLCCTAPPVAFKDRAPASANAESLPVRHRFIVSAIEKRDYGAADRELRELKSSDPALFRVNNYDYLLGRIAEKRDNFAAAKQSYNAVIDQNSILSEYAVRRLAELARKQKDLASERVHLNRLLKEYPDSLLADEARRRLAESYFESGQYAPAAALFRARASYSGLDGREAMGRVGVALLELGKDQEAESIFVKLLSGSRDDQALLAALKLDELDEKNKRASAETELLARARVYLFNRDTKPARKAYKQLIERFPNSRSMPEALYSIGRSHFIDYDYESAIKWFDRAHDEFPNSNQGELGFYQAGHAYQNLGRYQDAIKRYIQVIDDYPQSNWLGGAHLNMIDSLRSAGKYNEALEWCRRTQERFNSVTGTTALFSEAKIRIIKGDYAEALDAFTRLRSRNLSQRAAGATNRSEVEFMRAYCFEKMGRVSDAVDAYFAFPVDRDGYYGNRATLRLSAIAHDPKFKDLLSGKFKYFLESARKEIAATNYNEAKASANQALRIAIDSKGEAELLDMLRRCYSNLPAYNQFFNFTLEPAGRDPIESRSRTAKTRSHRALADELIFLGLYDEGAPELRAGLAAGDNSGFVEGDADESDSESRSHLVNIAQRRRKGSSPRRSPANRLSDARQYSLAVYLNRGSHAHPAIRYGEGRFSNVPDDFRIDLLPRDIAELLYPAPYRDDLIGEARTRKLDPRLMLAVARQESRFNPSAKSLAAARGLFQFIPLTADQVSRQLKLTNFNQDDLYIPSVAIDFAGQYLSDLFNEFKDNPYAVAASYNGGEHNVRRWVERARSNEADRVVIEIAYYESKDYVYKVMNNYWAYCRLYREDLSPR